MSLIDIKNQMAIIGAAETNELGKLPGISRLQLHAESAINAIRDAGISKDDIDGIACAGASPAEIAHYLGIVPKYVDGTAVGGTSFLIHVRHAAAAIAAGLCETVLVTHGESGRSRVGAPRMAPDPAGLAGQFEMPFGPLGPPTMFTVPVLRFLKETGQTTEHLAWVAVQQRKWSSQVPRAMMRDEITIDDVANSRWIAYPFHLLECCLVTDGGGAVIVTSKEKAATMNLNKPPVYIVGTGESIETPLVSQMQDFSRSQAFIVSGRQAFESAGITHDDVDHLMIYDAFAHLPMYGLEDLGFVGRGESGDFIKEGNTAPGGKLPMNTNGGGLSYTHTGMYGMFAMQESIRQVRGEAAAQVPDVKISIAHGVGGMFMASGTLVLTNQDV
jgi:acetyl-CoA acetyltransferase